MGAKFAKIVFTAFSFICSINAHASYPDLEIPHKKLSPQEALIPGWQTPKKYYKGFKSLGMQAIPEEKKLALKLIWNFRYFEGIDQNFLKDQAKLLNIQLDNGFSSKLLAIRLYLIHRENGLSISTYLPGIITATTFVTICMNIIAYPSRLPDGCTMAYAALSRVVCGGEAGPICPSTALAHSLSKDLVYKGYFHGLWFQSVGNIVTSIIAQTFKGLPDLSRYQYEKGFLEIGHAKGYLEIQDKEASKERTSLFLVCSINIALNAICIPSILNQLTGTLASRMSKISLSEYTNRKTQEGCFQLIDAFTALPCNMTLPWDFLKDADFYAVTLKASEANFMTIMPYLIPSMLTIFQLMIFALKLV